MTLVAATFHGTHREGMRLFAAIERNCSCQKMLGMVQGEICPLHKAIAEDQRFLDGLLVARRRADDLWREEQCRPREVE